MTRFFCGMLAMLAACGPDVTEVVVVVDAEEGVAARARWLAVRVFDTDGRLVVDRVDDLRGDVAFPARVPLTPRDGDATRTWRFEADARTALGCTFASVEAEGGYTRGFAETRELRLTATEPDPCPPGPGCDAGCDDGLACTDDACVEGWCFNEPQAGVCTVGGMCVTEGAQSDGDPCRVCVPELSTRAWSLAPGCDSAEVARFDAALARYGQTVAMSDGRVLVGAPLADADRGRVAAYAFDPEGAWVEEGELEPPDVGAAAELGASVAVWGEWALAGAPGDGVGRVFVFRHAASGWRPAGELTSVTSAPADRFGAAVALEGDVAVIGAPYAEAPVGEAGAAYVFRRREGDRWTELLRFEPPDPQRQAFFGESVALSGGRVIVGARYHDVDGQDSAGVAYLYTLDGDTLSEPTELVPSHRQAFGYFGYPVAAHGDVVAVTAAQDDSFSSDGGAVYVFDVGGEAPTEVAQLGMGPAGAQAGLGLAVHSGLLAAGYPQAGRGFVTIFERIDGVFSARPRVEGEATTGVAFGRAVALWDRWLAVGAPSAESGGVRLFEIRR